MQAVEAWSFDGMFSSCKDFGIWPRQITVSQLADHCAMLMEASLRRSTQLKTSKFFWRHLQQPWPQCVLTQMLRPAGCSAFNQFRIGFKSGFGLGDTQAFKEVRRHPQIFSATCCTLLVVRWDPMEFKNPTRHLLIYPSGYPGMILAYRQYEVRRIYFPQKSSSKKYISQNYKLFDL